MITVTKAGIMHEYEIKRTVADFVADKKKEKHALIDRYVRGEREYDKQYPGWTYKVKVPQPANYFWYVVPLEISERLTVPVHTGMLVVEGNWLHILHKAPRLHREHPTDKMKWQMLCSASSRFWSARRLLIANNIPFTETYDDGGL